MCVSRRRLSVITGISGSGKSTLMRGPFAGGTRAIKPKKRAQRGAVRAERWRHGSFEAVYEVDQSPIGKTSRSTPATYIKVFDEIRNLYAQLPVSRMRGYSARADSRSTPKAAAARRARARA
jgi:excinuclease ABC subunit A